MMIGNEQSNTFRPIAIYGMLLLISFGLIVGSYFVTSPSLAEHILSELGIAGLVGFTLAMTIERLSEEEFRRSASQERSALEGEFRKLAEDERTAIKKDVFYYVYGRKIPEEIRREINKQVLESDFVRQHLCLEFRLSTMEDPNTHEFYVKSVCSTQYMINNIAGEKKEFPLLHFVERSANPLWDNEVKFIGLEVEGCESPFSFDEAELRNKTAYKDTEISLNLDSNPVIVLPDVPTTVNLRYQGIRNAEGGHIYFSFTSHVCDLDLTVHVPNRELKVVADAYSPHELSTTHRHNPEVGYYNWDLKYPLLCYQSVKIAWTRVTPSTISSK